MSDLQPSRVARAALAIGTASLTRPILPPANAQDAALKRTLRQRIASEFTGTAFPPVGTGRSVLDECRDRPMLMRRPLSTLNRPYYCLSTLVCCNNGEMIDLMDGLITIFSTGRSARSLRDIRSWVVVLIVGGLACAG